MKAHLILFVVSLLLISICGKSFVGSLKPAEGQVFDFFKEWASARNYFAGAPIYSSQTDSLRKYLALKLEHPERYFDEYNTHPPAAILIGLPFAAFQYREAQLAWNLFSLFLFGSALWLIAKELNIRFTAWAYLPFCSLLLMCDPLRQTINQGQLNCLLLFLITCCWVADRRGLTKYAGFCAAAAATIKLYPAFLVFYFLFRKDWKTVFWFVVSCIGITAVTLIIFRFQAFVDYVTVVLPNLKSETNHWGNASIFAFWERLFGETNRTIQTFLPSKPMLMAGVVASSGLVLFVLACCIRKSQSRTDKDVSFGMTVSAMLLISPMTWHHYFLLLALPLWLLWIDDRRSTFRRIVFYLIICSLWISPRYVWYSTIKQNTSQTQTAASSNVPETKTASTWSNEKVRAQPRQSLTSLSYQFYALLGLFFLLYRSMRNKETQTPQPISETPLP